ncbi:MAG TPA: hypothetical protein VGT98_05835, partial [Candidatus Elarobacter sp.]|nr:hypothetical protein [Candidatus Elarobacter sp.]
MNGERIDAPHCDDITFDAAGQHFAALLKLDPESKAMQRVSFTLAGKIPVEAPARVMDRMIM